MPLQSGDRLGPYAIQDLLGVGGMGEVYRGRDTRLGRDVALKVISPTRVGDPGLRRRFEREARAASVLNHPSIVTVYDVGDTDGIPWIAMEWVEGRTLRQAMAQGPLHVREALKIAQQIAGGLAAAHAKGIVHRDLKPGNVMLTADGRCKIVDFGLARQTPGEALEGPISQADTMDAPAAEATREGAILGTVGYMSPEQASGKPVDFRSDQFSFGVIAYEMLTGQRAFERPTPVETLAAVIREEPVPLSSLRPATPEPLRQLIATCLAKRPEDRFASTRDLAAALDSLATGSTGAAGIPTETDVALQLEASPRRARGRRALLSGAALGLALAAAWAFRLYTSSTAIDTLAVLPFENKSNDPEAEYLGDGLTESLIGLMSRLPSLRVMARATVFRFKGTPDPLEAGRKLGVGAILTGSVSRRGDRLSISAELVEIETGARLWGETYDRPLADLLLVQDSIASDISERLRPHLSADDKRTLAQRGTSNPEAYDLFLKATFALAKDTEEGDLEARRLFREAVEKDPRFVEARAGFALTFARSAVNGYERPADTWPRLDEEMAKALDLDPGNVHARAQVANRHFFFDWDFRRTEREYRALLDDPRLLQLKRFRPIHPIALFLWMQGRTEEAVALMDAGLLDDPGNVETRTMRADFLAQAGQLDAAIAGYRGIVESEPGHPGPRFGLAEVLKRKGDVTGAIEALRKAYELTEEQEGVDALSSARSEQDYENAEVVVARRRLADLEALGQERYVSPLDVARLHARVGDREKAFADLEKAFGERSPGLVFLKIDRVWDRIRDDSRFADLVRRVGIP